MDVLNTETRDTSRTSSINVILKSTKLPLVLLLLNTLLLLALHIHLISWWNDTLFCIQMMLNIYNVYLP